MLDENPSLVDDPHINGIRRVIDEITSSGSSHIGFFLEDAAQCELGYLENEEFLGLGRSVGRAFDMRRNDGDCGDYKLVLGAMLATYVGACEEERRAELVDEQLTDGQSGFAAYAIEDFKTPWGEVPPAYAEAWSRAARSTGVSTLTSEDVAAVYGVSRDEHQLTLMGSDAVVVAAGTVAINLRSNQATWSYAQQNPLSQVPEPTGTFMIGEGLTDAFSKGSVVEVVGMGDATNRARWVPVGEAESTVRRLANGTVAPFTAQQYLLVATGTSDGLSTVVLDDALTGLSMSTVFGGDSILDQMIGSTITAAPGLVSSENPLRDQFMLQYDITLEDIPPEIARVLFTDIDVFFR